MAKKKFISLKDKLNEEELKEFDYEKNDKGPGDYSYGSAMKIFWKCKNKHSYMTSPNDKVSHHSGCPYCANQKLLKGFNDLESVYPNLAKEWNYDKNELKPDEVIATSNNKYWWKCTNNHTWESAPSTRKKGHGCPYCSGQMVTLGENDLATTNPELIIEWSPLNKLKPNEVSRGTNKKVIWEHIKKRDGKEFVHRWEAIISSRAVNGNGCPYCTNQKILPKYNDLKTLRPDLMKEWNFDKNTLNPSELAINSTKKVHWKHILERNGKEFVHEWESVVYSRTSGGRNCPICSGKKILVGFNDFYSNHPTIAKDWDYSKNTFSPKEVTSGSNKKVHWICSKGHEYEAPIVDRCYGDGCPLCSKRQRVSLPEKVIYYYIKKLFPDTIASYKSDWLLRNELDIYIPSIKFAIEYDGQKWHMDKYEHDLEKNKLCKDNGVKLFRIREPKCPKLPIKSVYELKTTNIKELEEVLVFLVEVLSKRTRRILKLDINIVRDIDEILKLLEE